MKTIKLIGFFISCLILSLGYGQHNEIFKNQIEQLKTFPTGEINYNKSLSPIVLKEISLKKVKWQRPLLTGYPVKIYNREIDKCTASFGGYKYTVKMDDPKYPLYFKSDYNGVAMVVIDNAIYLISDFDGFDKEFTLCNIIVKDNDATILTSMLVEDINKTIIEYIKKGEKEKILELNAQRQKYSIENKDVESIEVRQLSEDVELKPGSKFSFEIISHMKDGSSITAGSESGKGYLDDYVITCNHELVENNMVKVSSKIRDYNSLAINIVAVSKYHPEHEGSLIIPVSLTGEFIFGFSGYEGRSGQWGSSGSSPSSSTSIHGRNGGRAQSGDPGKNIKVYLDVCTIKSTGQKKILAMAKNIETEIEYYRVLDIKNTTFKIYATGGNGGSGGNGGAGAAGSDIKGKFGGDGGDGNDGGNGGDGGSIIIYMTPAFKALNYTGLKTYNYGGYKGHPGIGGGANSSYGGTRGQDGQWGYDGQSGPTPIYKVVQSIDFEWKPDW